MYAIVKIAGQQFKVERGIKVYVHRLKANEGADVEFDDVLLIDNKGKITVGSPTVEGAKVAATIIQHLRGDKVLVFKKKRRKTYQKLNGHRQDFTQILVQGILTKGESVTDKLDAKKHEFVRRSKKEVTYTPIAEVEEVVTETVSKKPTVKKSPAKRAAVKKTSKKKED